MKGLKKSLINHASKFLFKKANQKAEEIKEPLLKAEVKVLIETSRKSLDALTDANPDDKAQIKAILKEAKEKTFNNLETGLKPWLESKGADEDLIELITGLISELN